MSVELQRTERVTAAEANMLILATEKQVFGFDLLETFRVAIGRHDSNDLSFDSRNVSNYHAEILCEAEALVLHDLGSTKGSYVNEERVKRRKLQHGDCIRIGNNKITVKLANEDAKESEASTPSVPMQGSFQRTGPAPTVREIRLNLCALKNSVRLTLTRVQSHQSYQIVVYVHDGRIVFAEAGSAHAEKALYRVFEWHRDEYKTEPFPADDSLPRSVTVPVETLVEEGEQQAKELDELMSKLPPLEAALRLREGCRMRICDFTPLELDVFQAVIRDRTLRGAIEGCGMTDLRVMTQVHALIRKKVFELDEGSSFWSKRTSLPDNRSPLSSAPVFDHEPSATYHGVSPKRTLAG